MNWLPALQSDPIHPSNIINTAYQTIIQMHTHGCNTDQTHNTNSHTFLILQLLPALLQQVDIRGERGAVEIDVRVGLSSPVCAGPGAACGAVACAQRSENECVFMCVCVCCCVLLGV